LRMLDGFEKNARSIGSTTERSSKKYPAPPQGRSGRGRRSPGREKSGPTARRTYWAMVIAGAGNTSPAAKKPGGQRTPPAAAETQRRAVQILPPFKRLSLLGFYARPSSRTPLRPFTEPVPLRTIGGRREARTQVWIRGIDGGPLSLLSPNRKREPASNLAWHVPVFDQSASRAFFPSV